MPRWITFGEPSVRIIGFHTRDVVEFDIRGMDVTVHLRNGHTATTTVAGKDDVELFMLAVTDSSNLRIGWEMWNRSKFAPHAHFALIVLIGVAAYFARQWWRAE